jgi:hypothetical protein
MNLWAHYGNTRNSCVSPLNTQCGGEKEQKVLADKQRRCIEQEVLIELLKLRAGNGGNCKYGDVPCIVNQYRNMDMNMLPSAFFCTCYQRGKSFLWKVFKSIDQLGPTQQIFHLFYVRPQILIWFPPK